MIAYPLLLAAFLGADPAPTPRFPLSKETTFVLGPLDKDGYIDGAAAINERLGRGITPEKNATVLLWKALGPRPGGGKGMPPQFFQRVGIEEPPAAGDYFIDLNRYLTEQLKLGSDDSEKRFAIQDQQTLARQRPWAEKEYPEIAAWLKMNEKPLNLVVEAMQRPEYYNPLVSGNTLTGPQPIVPRSREIAGALCARAMRKLGDGKVNEAWNDLIACHRLGRFVTRGPTLPELLVGIAIDSIASHVEVAHVAHAKLTSEQVQKCLKDLQGLPPLTALAEKVDFTERVINLDGLQRLHRGDPDLLKWFGFKEKASPEEIKALQALNWEPALRETQSWSDRLAAAARGKDRATRNRLFARINREFAALQREAAAAGKLPQLLAERDKRKDVGKDIANLFLADTGLIAIRLVQNASDRAEQVQRNLHVAVALAAYQREQRRYPEKLEELTPRYLASIPDDLFSGKPLLYQVTENGYVVYSVGENGKDDGGHGRFDGKNFVGGDDIGFRMPLPELKRK